MIALSLAYILASLQQANADPLDFLFDVAEAVFAAPNAIADGLLDGVEYNFGRDARDVAEVTYLVLGPGKFGKARRATKMRPGTKGLGSTSATRGILKIEKAVSVFLDQKGCIPLRKNVHLRIKDVHFVCDLVAKSKGLLCIELIHDIAKEMTLSHAEIGFGYNQPKTAHLSEPNAAENAQFLGLKSEASFLLRTEVWVCPTSAKCREWKPDAATPLLSNLPKPPLSPP